MTESIEVRVEQGIAEEFGNKQDWDPEVVPLCDALNSIPGIQTLESCCGHGTQPFKIWFEAESVAILNLILWAGYHRWWSWNNDWMLNLDFGDPFRNSTKIKLLLTSRDKGALAYRKADIFAERIKAFVLEADIKETNKEK